MQENARIIRNSVERSPSGQTGFPRARWKFTFTFGRLIRNLTYLAERFASRVLADELFKALTVRTCEPASNRLRLSSPGPARWKLFLKRKRFTELNTSLPTWLPAFSTRVAQTLPLSRFDVSFASLAPRAEKSSFWAGYEPRRQRWARGVFDSNFVTRVVTSVSFSSQEEAPPFAAKVTLQETSREFNHTLRLRNFGTRAMQ